jgi:hypothetical protein
MGRIIIPLEEVKTKAMGVGDEYWGEERVADESQTRISKKSQSKSQSKSQTKAKAKEILADQDSEEDLPPVEKIQARPRQKPASIAISSDDEEEEEEEPVQRPTRNQKEKLKDKTSERGNKRPAAAVLTKAGPAKKVMTTAKGRGAGRGKKEDSDSEDDLKFRFRGRG